jgi:hypothetical protein
MPHPRLRPTAVPAAVLVKVIDGWEPHASQSSIGYHGEQFGWIRQSRFRNLSVAECYRQSRRELERWASPVIAGSTHFGNFGEDYERDFEGAAEAGFLLWRNSYKRCGLTPMRPYRLPNGKGGQIAGLLGYLDAICEDIAAEDIAAPPLSAAAEKALAWLDISGGGHLFLHAHAVQFAGLAPRRGLRSWLRSSAVMLARRRLASGRARYRRGCDLVRDAGLTCLTHNQVVRHRQQLDLLRLDTEAVNEQSAARARRRLTVRVRAPFTGLTLATLESYPVAVVDDEGRQLPIAAERSGDWNYLTVTGTPGAPARVSGLAEIMAAGLA